MTAFKKAYKPKTGGGRPPKIGKEIIAKICNVLRSGAYVETAAAVSGVSKDTLYEWLKRAKKEPASIYGDFSDAVQKAMAEAEIRDLMVIDKMANGADWEYERYKEGEINEHTGRLAKTGELKLNARGNPIPIKVGFAPNWAASAWRLERRNPKRWGRVDRPESEIEEKKDDTIKIEFVDAEKK